MPSEARRAHLQLVTEKPATQGGDHSPTLDDSELLRALRSSDPAAASAVYDRARPIVERTVSRLLGARDREYEDVLQLAFVEFIDTIDRFRGECPLDAWISVIAARTVYKHIRRRRLERRFFSEASVEEISELAARAMTPSVVLRSALARVRRHLQDMDEGRSWAFVLHDVHGYDLAEIAQILQISMSAAQSRLVRGRREMHERIQRDPELAQVLEEHVRQGEEA